MSGHVIIEGTSARIKSNREKPAGRPEPVSYLLHLTMKKQSSFSHFMDFQSSPLQKQEIRDCPEKRHLLSLNHSILSFAIMALCQGQKTPIQPTGRNKHEY